MKVFRILIVLFFIQGTTCGQTSSGAIVGTVIDIESSDIVIGANLVLCSPEGKDLLYGAATDINGRFFIRNIPVGLFKLKVSCVGYQPFETSFFMVQTDSTYKIDVQLDSYSGKTAEDAQKDIRSGIFKIYLLASMFPPSKAQENLAKAYGFEIGNTACQPMRTDRYDSVMVQYLASRNGEGWYKNFLGEWKKIKSR